MNKYQYDDEYFVAATGDAFLYFLDPEEEEAFARHLTYGRN